MLQCLPVRQTGENVRILAFCKVLQCVYYSLILFHSCLTAEQAGIYKLVV
jgi:hypothetical protein